MVNVSFRASVPWCAGGLLFLLAKDLKTAAKSSKLPGWARGDSKWIDVSIQNQLLVLYEGAQPVYVPLVSTGKDGLVSVPYGS